MLIRKAAWVIKLCCLSSHCSGFKPLHHTKSTGCSVCGLWLSAAVKFWKGRPEECMGSWEGEHEWTNTQSNTMQRHTQRHTNWPVNTNKSSSSSWNTTMKQLWVPAEADSPTHWASHRQIHTHALRHWYTYQTLSHTLYVLVIGFSACSNLVKKNISFLLCLSKWCEIIQNPIQIKQMYALINFYQHNERSKLNYEKFKVDCFNF